MRSKPKNRWALAVLAALVAFAQFVVAAEPCRLAHDPAAPAQHAMASDEGCEAMPMDQASCIAQCLGQDDGVASDHSLFDAIISSASASTPELVVRAQPAKAIAEPLAPPGGRSLQILYCSYQS